MMCKKIDRPAIISEACDLDGTIGQALRTVHEVSHCLTPSRCASLIATAEAYAVAHGGWSGDNSAGKPSRHAYHPTRDVGVCEIAAWGKARQEAAIKEAGGEEEKREQEGDKNAEENKDADGEDWIELQAAKYEVALAAEMGAWSEEWINSFALQQLSEWYGIAFERLYMNDLFIVKYEYDRKADASDDGAASTQGEQRHKNPLHEHQRGLELHSDGCPLSFVIALNTGGDRNDDCDDGDENGENNRNNGGCNFTGGGTFIRALPGRKFGRVCGTGVFFCGR